MMSIESVSSHVHEGTRIRVSTSVESKRDLLDDPSNYRYVQAAYRCTSRTCVKRWVNFSETALSVR